MEINFIQWIPYYVVGLVGILLHIVSKLDKGQSPVGWIQANTKDFWFSLGAYHVVLFFWMDMGIQLLGMTPDKPNGMTFFLGWCGSSLLSNLVKKFENKIDADSAALENSKPQNGG